MSLFRKSLPPQMKLSKMIEQKQWHKVVKYTQSHDDVLDSFQENGSFLHEVCKHQAPLDLIVEIVRKSPGMHTQVDSNCRSPLHLAAKYGASPDVIEFLCSTERKMAGMQDSMGKTPLHWACESYSEHYSRKSTMTLKSALLLTIKILVRSSPTTVNLEDSNGMCAAEYALDTNTELNIFRVIQKASVKEWKRISQVTENNKLQQYNDSLLANISNVKDLTKARSSFAAISA